MNVYYWLIILLRLFFPTCNLFSFHQTKYGHFYEAKKRKHDIEIYSVKVYFLFRFSLNHRNTKEISMIKPNGNK